MSNMIQELLGQRFNPKDIYVRDLTQSPRTLVAGTITPVVKSTKYGPWNQGLFTLPDQGSQVFESWERKRKAIDVTRNYELARFVAERSVDFKGGGSVAAGKVCWMLVQTP